MIPLPRGSWGWLVLGLVLLVPILGFWKWRTGIDVQPTGNPAVRSYPAPFARPAGTGPIPGLSSVRISTAAGKLSSAPVVPGALPTPGAVPGTWPVGIPNPAEELMPQTAHGSLAASSVPVAGLKVAPSTGPAAGAPNANASASNPADRDPTLSPADLEKLAELKMPRQPADSGAKPKPRRQVRIEDQIHLDGIIASEDSINAIVNGDRVREHDVVLGARIRKISQTCVEFEYKKKTFSKCIKK